MNDCKYCEKEIKCGDKVAIIHKDCFNKIADLEAKLAEYEAIKNKYKTIFLDRFVDARVEDARIWKEECDKLKQQLAEKDAEIEDIKDHQKDLCLRCGGLTHIEYEQDKISFCIEKLTDVRSFVSDATEIKEPDYTKVCDYIEKQIEELKKGRD